MNTTEIGEHINWVHVRALCAALDLESETVRELVIEPWGISVTCYVRDKYGHHLRTGEGEVMTSTIHYPREAHSWVSRNEAIS